MMAELKKQGRRVDWARIRRDFGTGKFTDRELAIKHNTAREVITRRRRADRLKDPVSWPVDLRADVRRATAALLMCDQVTRTVTSGSQAESIFAAAAMVKDVILGHRGDARAARGLANALIGELADVTLHRDSIAQLIERAAGSLDQAEAASLAAAARELVKLHNRASTLQKLTDALARAQMLERRAFGIGDDDAGSNPLDTMNEHELQAEVDRLTQQMRERP